MKKKELGEEAGGRGGILAKTEDELALRIIVKKE